MKIKMTMQPSGLLNGVPWPEVGEEFDVPDVVAVDLLNAGMAEHVEAKAKVERATAKPTSTTRKKPAEKAAEDPADNAGADADEGAEQAAGPDSGADDS